MGDHFLKKKLLNNFEPLKNYAVSELIPISGMYVYKEVQVKISEKLLYFRSPLKSKEVHAFFSERLAEYFKKSQPHNLKSFRKERRPHRR